MKKNFFKSLIAIVSGIAVTFILSNGTDYLFRKANILPPSTMYVSSIIIITVILYRCIYNVIGSFIVAKLAPYQPMGHALGVGIFGFLGSLAGTIATWNMNLGPHWYPISVAITAIPCAWLGAKLNELKSAKGHVEETF